MKKFRGWRSFPRMAAVLTRKSFPAGRSVAFQGSSRFEKKNGVQRAGPRKKRTASEGRPHTMQLVRGGLGLLCGLNADEAAVTAPVEKFHIAGDEREKRVVLALAHIFAGLVLRPALAHENRACVDQLAAEALDAQPLPM